MNGTTQQATVKLSQEELETVLRLVGVALRDQHFSTQGRERVMSVGEKALQALFEIGEGTAE